MRHAGSNGGRLAVAGLFVIGLAGVVDSPNLFYSEFEIMRMPVL